MTEKMEKIEWFDDRFYRRVFEDGHSEFYPSSTTILNIIDKPYLRQWYGDLGTELARHRSKMAMARGSQIHDLINTLIVNLGKDDTEFSGLDASAYPQEIWLQLVNFQEWYNSFKPKILGAELEVFSDRYKYAGTLDLLIEIPDGEYNIGLAKQVHLPAGKYVVDFKTGNMSEEYHYQTASYAETVQADATIILLLNNPQTKTGWKCEIRTHGEMIDDFDSFLHALALFNRHNPPKPNLLCTQ